MGIRYNWYIFQKYYFKRLKQIFINNNLSYRNIFFGFSHDIAHSRTTRVTKSFRLIID